MGRGRTLAADLEPATVHTTSRTTRLPDGRRRGGTILTIGSVVTADPTPVKQPRTRFLDLPNVDANIIPYKSYKLASGEAASALFQLLTCPAPSCFVEGGNHFDGNLNLFYVCRDTQGLVARHVQEPVGWVSPSLAVWNQRRLEYHDVVFAGPCVLRQGSFRHKSRLFGGVQFRGKRSFRYGSHCPQPSQTGTSFRTLFCTIDNEALSGLFLVVTDDSICDLAKNTKSDEWGLGHKQESAAASCIGDECCPYSLPSAMRTHSHNPLPFFG
ncbi:hypothetical protein F4679DRAFT_334037 [Xylaria curta]|nr:hypothetical protein F4679DRAFT_334037 [Xylaria curta]